MQELETIDHSNPHGICTWKPVEECEGCTVKGKLKCRFNFRDLGTFLSFFLVFLIPSITGMVSAGYGWYILGWVAFMLFFFEVWEIKILCSHCPYYAQEGHAINCIANYKSMKLWKYNPSPMDRSEKIQLFAGFGILFGYPLLFMVLGQQFAWAGLSLLAAGLFFVYLQTRTCNRCVNFSCPLNRVPKKTVDAYLARNPVMREAWEKAGYELE